MTALALGRRQLAAHPSPYHGATCAQVHVQRHVHVVGDDRPHFFMPDGCAACGRTWFAEDEITYMGYCGDCWPGNAMLLDYTDGAEAVPAEYPQPVRARGRAPVGIVGVVPTERPDVRACMACTAMQIKYDQATAACAQHRKPVYPDVDMAFVMDPAFLFGPPRSER